MEAEEAVRINVKEVPYNCLRGAARRSGKYRTPDLKQPRTDANAELQIANAASVRETGQVAKDIRYVKAPLRLPFGQP